MKRRVSVLVLVVLAFAMVISFHRELWFLVAYERADSAPGEERFVLYQKRFEGLPGAVYFCPDQPCIPCVGGNHSDCSRRTYLTMWKAQFEAIPDRLKSFRCTCIDGHHDETRCLVCDLMLSKSSTGGELIFDDKTFYLHDLGCRAFWDMKQESGR